LNGTNRHMSDSLLVKYLLGEASPEEARLIHQWMNESEENRILFEQFKKVWEHSLQLAPTAEINEEAAWQRFRARTVAQPRAVVKPMNRWGWMRIAALLILVAGLSYIAIVLQQKDPANITLNAQMAVLRDTLPDGTRVTLNKQASITYSEKFGKKSRNVILQGEAFFDVVPDKEKPFIVHVNDVDVTVVGTSFNIRSKPGFTEVIVETGVVRVTHKESVTELHPGQKLVIGADASTPKVEVEDNRLYNYYHTRELVCDSTPLWKVVEVLNRAYNTNIIVERDALKQLPLDATFTNESIDVILEIIRETFNTYHIEIAKTDQKIILR